LGLALAGDDADFGAALADDSRLDFASGVDLVVVDLGEALRRDGVVDCDMSEGLHSFLLVVAVVGGGGGGGVPCFIMACL
jgi:hypothetical protein